MRTINPPTKNAFILYRNIVRNKNLERRNRLNAIENEIRTHYGNYLALRTNLGNISASTYINPEKEDLLHCYNTESDNLNRLKAIISDTPPDEIKNRCLYCLIGNSTSYDHYLPKEDFPEFAVNIFNLFPSCGTCNSKKGVHWLIAGRRLFINFYYDVIPNVRYLKAKLRFYGSIPKATFRIEQPAGMSNEIFDLISSHFGRLELLRRFAKNSSEVFSEARKRIRRDCSGSSKGEIRNLLLGEAQLWTEMVQENYWKVALYEALADSTKFIDDCFDNL